MSVHDTPACRADKEAIATKFLDKVTDSVAAAVELKDVAPLLEAAQMHEGLVALCVKKADALVRLLCLDRGTAAV
jgi:hypothetical protein